MPHGWPAAATVTAAQVLLWLLQTSPALRSQPGPVFCVGSQVAPGCATAAWQLPLSPVWLFAPTHDRPAPQGAPRPQLAPLAAPTTTQVWVSLVQARPGPQPVSSAHEAPAIGGGAQVPHALSGGIAQNPVSH